MQCTLALSRIREKGGIWRALKHGAYIRIHTGKILTHATYNRKIFRVIGENGNFSPLGKAIPVHTPGEPFIRPFVQCLPTFLVGFFFLSWFFETIPKISSTTLRGNLRRSPTQPAVHHHLLPIFLGIVRRCDLQLFTTSNCLRRQTFSPRRCWCCFPPIFTTRTIELFVVRYCSIGSAPLAATHTHTHTHPMT